MLVRGGELKTCYLLERLTALREKRGKATAVKHLWYVNPAGFFVGGVLFFVSLSPSPSLSACFPHTTVWCIFVRAQNARLSNPPRSECAPCLQNVRAGSPFSRRPYSLHTPSSVQSNPHTLYSTCLFRACIHILIYFCVWYLLHGLIKRLWTSRRDWTRRRRTSRAGSDLGEKRARPAANGSCRGRRRRPCWPGTGTRSPAWRSTRSTAWWLRPARTPPSRCARTYLLLYCVTMYCKSRFVFIGLQWVHIYIRRCFFLLVLLDILENKSGNQRKNLPPHTK